ncbi:MAG: ABC transporter permease [Anaerolineae bacterium]
MLTNIKELYRYRELMWIWTLREIRVRYKQSILGALWAILQPLSMMLIFTLVFAFLTRVPTDGIPYPLFSYVALLPWTFFSTSVSLGFATLVGNMNLVTRTYFPREILPIGSVGASFFDFAIASSIFLLMLVWYQVPLTWAMAWLPLILVVQIFLTLGITLLGASLNVLYRDIRFIVPLGLQIWLYITPVIYPANLIPAWLRPVYMLNPMAGIINAYRLVILSGQQPGWSDFGLATIESIALFVLGYQVFKRLEMLFADII